MGEGDSRLGQTIAGRYHLNALLGRGGFGTVYAARDTNPARPRDVALKALRFDVFENPERARRYLRREIEVLDRVADPNIVRLLDVIDEDGTVFLVMERLRGQTLAQQLLDGPRPPTEALRITLAIARALRALQVESCVHRDVKPANVFLANDGDATEPVVKLMDFGLAADLFGSVLQSREAVLGTLGYMPPEAFDDGRPDHRYDVWSLGVVLYEMLMGKRPFGAPGDTEATIIGKILNAELPPLTGMPRRWATFVRERLLVRDPEQRADPDTLIHWLQAEDGGRHEARVEADSSLSLALHDPAEPLDQRYVLRADGGLRGVRQRGQVSASRLQTSGVRFDGDAEESLVTGQWSLGGGRTRAAVRAGSARVELATVELGAGAGRTIAAELLAAGLEDLPRDGEARHDGGARLRLAGRIDGRPVQWIVPLQTSPSARLLDLVRARLAGPLRPSFTSDSPPPATRLRHSLVVGLLVATGLVAVAVLAISLAALGVVSGPSTFAAARTAPTAAPATKPSPRAETKPVVEVPQAAPGETEGRRPVDRDVPAPTTAPPPEPTPRAVPREPVAKVEKPPALSPVLVVTPTRSTLVPGQRAVALTVRADVAPCKQIELAGPSGTARGVGGLELPLPAEIEAALATQPSMAVGYRLRCADPPSPWVDHTLTVEPFPDF